MITIAWYLDIRYHTPKKREMFVILNLAISVFNLDSLFLSSG